METEVKPARNPSPPIVACADEIGAVTDYLRHFMGQSAVDAATAEVKRLSSYFAAMHKRMMHAAPIEKGGTQKPPFFKHLMWYYPPVDVYQPGDLQKAFIAVARSARNTILSEFAILPSGLVTEAVLQDLQGGEFEITDESTKSAPYSLGFINIMIPDHESCAHQSRYNEKKISYGLNSISLPHVTLRSDMMGAVDGPNARALFKDLQTIMSYASHDMLHTFTVTATAASVTDIMQVPFADSLKRYNAEINSKYDPNDPLGYESGLILGHARTVSYLKDSPEEEIFHTALCDYYDTLSTISDRLKGTPDAHRVIDYFSTIPLYALTRLVPFNHPLMQYCFDRAEAVDPDPDQLRHRKNDRRDLLKNDATAQTLRNYKSIGMPILKAADHGDYAAQKKIDLLALASQIALLHSPARRGSDVDRANRRVDIIDRNVINIIVKPPENAFY